MSTNYLQSKFLSMKTKPRTRSRYIAYSSIIHGVGGGGNQCCCRSSSNFSVDLHPRFKKKKVAQAAHILYYSLEVSIIVIKRVKVENQHLFIYSLDWSLFIFFIFILRFWNQILTCRSVKFSKRATSCRRSRVRYMLKRNSFSSSRV